MKILSSLFFFLAMTLFLRGQQSATISGSVIQDSDKSTLSFVTVSLLDAESTQLVSGAISDKKGIFVLSGIESGNYTLELSYIGFETSKTNILVGEKNLFYDLGSISMFIASNQIDEVTIKARKADVAAELDKKSFDMSRQISGSGGSVLDAMKNLPGIAVDQEGNIILRGSDKVAILIDGKQSGMTGFGNQRGLGNIPASNIESIEIINNPSSKYDANGMAGIINIIYKKEKSKGLNGDVGFAFGVGELTTRKPDLATQLGSFKQNPKLIPSFNLNYGSEKVNAFLQSELLFQKKLPNNEFTTRSYADGRNTISAVPENRRQSHYIIKGGVDYHLDKRSTLSFSTIYDYEHHIDTAQVPYISLDANKRYRYYHWKEDEITGFLNVRLNYEYKFEKPGHKLNIASQFTRGWEDESYFLNDSSAIRQGSDATRILAIENTSQFMLDYQKPLRSGRLELGTKMQIRTIPVSYDIFRGEQSIIYEGIGDWSDWGENIYSGYLNYVREKAKYDVEAGLRLEQTDVFYNIAPENIYYPENDAYSYFKLFPNIRFTFKPNLKNRLSLFFNNRVDRPGEPNLRIFPKYDDPELLKIGDPYVRPQFTQTYELAYKNIWETGSVMLSSYYRSIENSFLRIYSIDESNPEYDIINKIYQNVSHSSNLGFEMLFAQKISDIWDVSASLNWYNNVIDAYSGTIRFPYERSFSIEETIDQTWDMKVNSQFHLSSKTEIQFTGIYIAPKNIPQGRRLSRSSIDIGIKKTVLEGKGTITFSVSDIFNGFGIREEIVEKDFTALYENYFETQVARIGFNYKF